MRKKKRISLFDFCNIVFMLLLLLIILYPLYYTVIASLSDPKALASGEVIWKPVGFRWDAYKNVIEHDPIWIGYANTILYTVCGTLVNLIFTIPLAYVFSKKYLPGRGCMVLYCLFTMYFSGGLIPGYLLIKNLGMINTRWVMIITGASIYNVVVTRTYFQTSISESLYEAAEIDGASEWKRFASIAIPLAKPITAVMALYYAVGHWNSYFAAMLYINNKNLEPLQSVLRKLLISTETTFLRMLQDELTDTELLKTMAEKFQSIYTMKYALVFITSLPMLIAYPFIQKYFVKGVMVGSLKG